MKLQLLRMAWAFLLCVPMPGALSAEPVKFDESWREQGFLRLFTNDYVARGERLDVVSNGTVSIFWRPVDGRSRTAIGASWNWAVAQGVPPTDLTKKGGDDRNLALYFVFLDSASAQKASAKSARRVLNNPNARALVYVWGGANGRGEVFRSPYHPRLVGKVLRPADVGAFAESVDLEQDFADAFGEQKGVLVGIGVSADSDDTNTRIQAVISGLTLVVP